MAGDKDLGRIRPKDTRKRLSRSTSERKERWRGKEDQGVYYALLRLLQETGFGDDAFWNLARACDRKFVKEGEAIITPGTWEEIVFTAPRRGAILISRVDFYFPEPIGRQWVNMTFLYDGDANMYDFESERASTDVGPTTIYDTLLPDRWLVQDGKEIAFRMQNTHVGANAVVRFRIRGWTVGGGYRIKVRR